MVKRSISNRSVFEIREGSRIFLGFSQGWYKTGWQRTAGCGPTAVASLLYYLEANQRETGITLSRQEAVKRMEDVWQYVRPTMRGIPEAKLLYDGIVAYAKAKGLSLKLSMLNIDPKQKEQTILDALRFLETSIAGDAPVAFLNLNRGEEIRLDSWHWVVVTEVEYEPDGSAAWVEILDEGEIKRVDFAKWYHTTSMGGGLVSISA